MSTSQRRSTTKEELQIADVEIATERTFTSAGDIRLTFQSDLSGLKSKENLQQQIDDLWKTFLSATQDLISVSSSSAIIGPPTAIQNDIPIGQRDMGASPLLARSSRRYG